MPFRRVMKAELRRAMRGGVEGIKISISGRLNGADMARTESYKDGRIPLHTLRAKIDLGMKEALTTFGQIGIKVWTYAEITSLVPMKKLKINTLLNVELINRIR